MFSLSFVLSNQLQTQQASKQIQKKDVSCHKMYIQLYIQQCKSSNDNNDDDDDDDDNNGNTSPFTFSLKTSLTQTDDNDDDYYY